MQDKFDSFDKLPNVIKGELTKFLPTKDFINLSKTSKDNHKLFKTNQHLAPLQEARQFLHHVVRGDHEAVAKMLEKNPALMHIRGQVTDLSGRRFTNISGFEYCLWALDKHMWTKMLDCLPKTEEGEKIKAVLRTQYQKIKEYGVTYERHGVTTQTPEKHFDLEGTIIKQLQEYVDNDDDKQWRTGVGGAQQLLPIHIVDEYCSDVPFYPIPDFKEQPKSSKQFYNWLNNGEKESWFCEGSKLGIDFAIYKGVRGAGARWLRLPAGPSDVNAVRALCKVRTNDFIDLEDKLRPCIVFQYQI